MTMQLKYPLEMHWILDGGCLRSVWTTRQPRPIHVHLPQPIPAQLENQAA